MNFRVNINICRVCMKTNDGTSLLENKELGEMFVFTTGLKLNGSDDMPALICSKCSKRLHIANDFVKLAHETEKNLKAFLSKISKDFQLVTNNISDKSKINEDDEDDDLLSAILEDESIDKTPEESKQTPSKCVLVQKTNGAVCASQVSSNRKITIRDKSKNEMQESQLLTELKNAKRAAGDMSPESGVDMDSNLMGVNAKTVDTNIGIQQFKLYKPDVKMKIESQEVGNTSNLNIKCSIDFSGVGNGQPAASDELQNEDSPSHEIQILDYTDEESQTELEILEENLQPSDDTRSCSGAVEEQAARSDGFFKEYQAMLQEGDEYLEDNSSEHSKATTSNDLHLDDDTDELSDNGYLAVKNVEEAHIDEEHLVDSPSHTQPVTENITIAEKEVKLKPRKTQSRTNGRGASSRSAKQDDGLSSSKRFLCFKCNRDFSTKTNLTRHMATHEGNRPFQCNVCNKSFTQNVSLKQHMYTHTGEKPYRCEVCNRGFTQCKSLVFHIRRHTGEKPFPCEKCGAVFRQKDGLKTHILKRHTIKSQDELTTCAICKELLPDNTVQEHMKKHLNDYVRVDSVMSCANREANTDDDSDMLLEYIDDDPLHEKSTVFIGGDSVPESADDIGSAAHVVDLMTTSALEPSRAKKYQCRKCFKCFAIKKNLIRHLTTHNVPVSLDMGGSDELRAPTSKEADTPEEVYQCELCELMFASAEEMRKHSNLDHTFKCHECPQLQFTSRRLLSEHMMKHGLSGIQ